MTTSSEYHNKLVVITGATGGVGLATTLAFQALGAKVFATDIFPLDPSSPLLALTQSSSANLAYYPSDIISPSAPESIVAAALSHFSASQVDILLNIAGTGDNFAAAELLEEKIWDKVIAVNLTAPTLLIKAVLPGMLAAKKGVIVNIVSRAAYSGAAAGVAYTASKHGLLGVTKQTAFRYRYEGIRCVGIAPGAIRTNFLGNSGFVDENHKAIGWDTKSYDILSAYHVLGRAGPGEQEICFEPSEVTNAIEFLASDKAAMINGAVLPVDNGWGTM